MKKWFLLPVVMFALALPAVLSANSSAADLPEGVTLVSEVTVNTPEEARAYYVDVMGLSPEQADQRIYETTLAAELALVEASTAEIEQAMTQLAPNGMIPNQLPEGVTLVSDVTIHTPEEAYKYYVEVMGLAPDQAEQRIQETNLAAEMMRAGASTTEIEQAVSQLAKADDSKSSMSTWSWTKHINATCLRGGKGTYGFKHVTTSTITWVAGAGWSQNIRTFTTAPNDNNTYYITHSFTLGYTQFLYHNAYSEHHLAQPHAASCW